MKDESNSDGAMQKFTIFKQYWNFILGWYVMDVRFSSHLKYNFSIKSE
jgi:hypothetical protein